MLKSKNTENQCRRLWKICFGDSQEFIDLYFENRADDHNTFVLSLPGGVVACQSQCFIYGLSEHECDKAIMLGYISGLGTLPEYRGHGYAEEVMRQMLAHMSQEKIDYSFLIPANDKVADWYARHFGYRHTHDYTKYLIQPDKLERMRKVHLDNPVERLDVMDLCFLSISQCNHFLLQDDSFLEDQWEVCEMSGGGVYAMLAPWKAFLFIEMIDNQPVVLDIFAHMPVDREKIITWLNLTVCARVPILTLPVCATAPIPEDAHFSLLLD